ncbi:unnamed protein product [Brassica rapa subsp. trilocularis]
MKTFVLKYYRNLLGEDLGPLSTKELESLERRLDSSLKKIRALRTQLMLDQINDLQSKLADGYQMPLNSTRSKKIMLTTVVMINSSTFIMLSSTLWNASPFFKSGTRGSKIME